MNRILKALALLLVSAAPALAGSATVGYTPGTGTNFAVTTDGGGNFNGRQTIWDSSAAANGLAIDATSNAAHVVLYQGTTALSAINGAFTNILQGNLALSAGNGLYSNVLQGNAALSLTNGIYSNLLQGNLALSPTNGLYTNLLQGNGVVSAANGIFVLPTTAAVWSVTGVASNAAGGVAAGSSNVNSISYNYGWNGATSKWDQLQVDATDNLKINCISGCASGTVSNSGLLAPSSTSSNSIAYGYSYNGTNWVQNLADTSGFLKVNCATGCGGTGTISNAGSLAPSSTNTQGVAYNYAYNGTNWVQALADGSGFIEVNTAAGGIQGFAPGSIWSGPNGVGIAAGEQHMGEVGTRGGVLTSSALGVATTSHGDGICLGSLVTFSNAVRNSAAALTPGTSGLIQDIAVGFTTSAVPTNLDVIFFTSNPGTNPCATGDGSTFTIAAGDIGKALPALHMQDVTKSAQSYLMSLHNIAMRYGLASSTTLYAALVNRTSTFTPGVNVSFNISVFED